MTNASLLLLCAAVALVAFAGIFLRAAHGLKPTVAQRKFATAVYLVALTCLGASLVLALPTAQATFIHDGGSHPGATAAPHK